MSKMVNVKEQIRSILTTSVITNRVPATSITSAWTDFVKPLPAISYQEIDSFNVDNDYFDNEQICDNVTVGIDLWDTKPLTALFMDVNEQMELFGWNRVSATDLYEQDSKIYHKATRYSKVLYR